LIAQDLTYYGLDVDKTRSLPTLLRTLSDVPGVEWLRLQYAYPAGFPMEVLDVMAERDNICKYLDMPLQSGSDTVLRLMRRGITREKTMALLEQIRTKVPGIAIRTTLIAGHPGETEADHEETLRFVEESRFDRLGVFTYSHEDQTHSGTMSDDVAEEDKQRRADEIMALQQGISLELNQAKVGTRQRVLIDRYESGHFMGRTQHDSPEVDNEVLIPASDRHYLATGSFTEVMVTAATEFDLIGSVVENEVLAS
jgi:ribosomal protein S12 methylthiotransferase